MPCVLNGCVFTERCKVFGLTAMSATKCAIHRMVHYYVAPVFFTNLDEKKEGVSKGF